MFKLLYAKRLLTTAAIMVSLLPALGKAQLAVPPAQAPAGAATSQSGGVGAGQPLPFAQPRLFKLGAVAQVKSWGYQLQNLDVNVLAQSPHDVLVIDYSTDGGEEARLTPRDLQRLKTKPDGSPRTVLSYMSIGEAETYRYYWKWTWGGRWYNEWLGWFLAPKWLGSHNSEWGGNYAVRYWDPSWKAVILGSGGYLDRILTAGFDGVWLDKVDSSIEKVAKSRPSAVDDMRTFVREIAEHGRKARPGFLVVPQNGEELLDDENYRQVIDAIGKEDLLFGEIKDKQENPASIIAKRTGMLKLLTRDGKPVLAVEYLDNAKEISSARRALSDAGFVPHFTDRALDHLRVGDLPVSGRSRSSSVRRRP